MEKVGVLVVSYGSREAAIIDALKRSNEYAVNVYVADKQLNPFNVENATKHVVIPDLDIEKIAHFAETNRDKIDFGIVGPEKPIIEGVRDVIEKRTEIPIICPMKDAAIESSKVKQRVLFQRIVPKANPRYRVFDPKKFRNIGETKKAVIDWLDELENQAVVKPDKPAAGKGVGVWGDHFNTREQLIEHFLANFRFGPVIIEEKIDGEESSFQAFCDGRHLVPLPDTRDYKRAFDGDKGSNTGGMGSYKDAGPTLPFLTKEDREKEIEIVRKIFDKWHLEEPESLRGIPFYVAFMHTTSEEPKILENNSRPGDPEIINLLPIIKNDFVDVCFRILEGALNHVEFEPMASVVTYKVPPSYGGYDLAFPDNVKMEEAEKPIDLSEAYILLKKYKDNLRVYPGSMEFREGETYALKSRAVCTVGIAIDIEDARQISLEAISAIEGGGLWNRTDIASKQHISASRKHIKTLRNKP